MYNCIMRSLIIMLIVMNLFFRERFGLVYIDFNDPNRTRRPKLSCNWLKEVIRSRKLISSTDYIRKSITVQL